VLGLLALAVLASSCAYYNTLFVAKRYYYRATDGKPYRFDRQDSPDVGSINKSIDYSKKLLANYSKSKWVDDAYLLWARGFLAKNDPLQTVTMLQDFTVRYPKSPLAGEATFYRGVALRQARRYTEALAAFDDYFAHSPRKDLLPYAHIERARTLMSLDRPADAAAAAGVVVERWPKSSLAVTARITRAEARFDQGAFDKAREDYHVLGRNSRSDDERLDYLLRESECLESGRHFDEALSLLRGALGHEHEPALSDTTGGRPLMVLQNQGYDRYGRLLNRTGTVELLAGQTGAALESFRRVVHLYPRHPLAAEAQFRIGYAYEVGADDFDKARAEYQHVKEIGASSPFTDQALQRQTALDQLAKFRTAGGDSSEQRVEAGFLLAEQYLFQLDKPERALEEYRKIQAQYAGSPWAGKALNAQAWVLRRKLDQPAEADSLLWKVVHDYPASEAQLAARDYLEQQGHEVLATLIQQPPPRRFSERDSLRADSVFVADSVRYANAKPLTPPPTSTPLLGVHPTTDSETLGPGGATHAGLGLAVATADSSHLPPGAFSPGVVAGGTGFADSSAVPGALAATAPAAAATATATAPAATAMAPAAPTRTAAPPASRSFFPGAGAATLGAAAQTSHAPPASGAGVAGASAQQAPPANAPPAPPDSTRRRAPVERFQPRGGKIQ
jgi:tetratricopeptide (TPR) repeat protein